jgi:hypothetical protein
MLALLVPFVAVTLTATGASASTAPTTEQQDRDPALVSRTVDDLLACGGSHPYCGSDLFKSLAEEKRYYS